MIFQILQSGLNAVQNTVLLAVMLVTVLFSMTLHEFAHGYVSYLQGDSTAKAEGRLTLNPFKHIDTVGLLCMLFCGFGWARAVPVDPRRYRKPKKGMAITAVAGPLTNLAIGICSTVLVSVIVWLWETGIYRGMPIIRHMTEGIYETVYMSLYIVLYYNLLLAVFNMLPIPPLDGSRLLYAFLPDKYYFGIMRYEKLILLVVFFLLWSGMFTGVFEFLVDFLITVVSKAVLFALELLLKIIM